MLAACPAARAAATAAGTLTSRAAAPPRKRWRISSATSSSPRAKARVRAIASRGRLSLGAAVSNKPSTRSAQSAAHAATIRRSASLNVCGEPTPPIVPPRFRLPSPQSRKIRISICEVTIAGLIPRHTLKRGRSIGPSCRSFSLALCRPLASARPRVGVLELAPMGNASAKANGHGVLHHWGSV